MDNIFLAELVGTAILILLGDGVVAGVLLAKSKAENAGWIVITSEPVIFRSREYRSTLEKGVFWKLPSAVAFIGEDIRFLPSGCEIA